MIKVLIADDQELIRESLKIVLNTHEDLQVIDTVEDGFGVLDSLKRNIPDVILMDIRMPRMDGVYCTKMVKEAYPDVKIIILTTFDDDDFPGYDRVKLLYPQLRSILDRGKKDWIAALENQKAVYLITDINTGKLYVGSATSDYGMLLQRWRSYADNGHGGNKRLKEIVDSDGIDYVLSLIHI